MMFIPSVFYKKDGFKESSADLFSRLLNLGCIFINGTIDGNTAMLFTAAVQHIVIDLQIKEITVYINSPGGELYSGLAIIDVMKFGFTDVRFLTKCVGLAASAASLILSAGHDRSMSINSRVMIHQPLGRVMGQASDIKIYADQIEKERKLIINLYTKYSNGKRDKDFFTTAIDRDTYLDGDDALTIGLVDSVFGEIA